MKLVRVSRPAMAEDVLPVEVKLHDRGLPLGSPGTNPGRSFGQAGFVDESHPPSLSGTLAIITLARM
jgi:hypothetical protein